MPKKPSHKYWSGANANEFGRTRVLKYVLYNEQRERSEAGLGEGALRADGLIALDAVVSFSNKEITQVLVRELLHAVGFMSQTDRERFESVLSDIYVRRT